MLSKRNRSLAHCSLLTAHTDTARLLPHLNCKHSADTLTTRQPSTAGSHRPTTSTTSRTQRRGTVRQPVVLSNGRWLLARAHFLCVKSSTLCLKSCHVSASRSLMDFLRATG